MAAWAGGRALPGVLRRRWPVAIAAALITGMLVVGLASLRSPGYTCTSVVSFTQRDGVTLNKRVTNVVLARYARSVSGSTVQRAAEEAAGLDRGRLTGKAEATVPAGTSNVVVTVGLGDGDDCRKAADQIAETLVTAGADDPLLTATISLPADRRADSTLPRWAVGVVGLLAAAAAAVGAAVGVDRLVARRVVVAPVGGLAQWPPPTGTSAADWGLAVARHLDASASVAPAASLAVVGPAAGPVASAIAGGLHRLGAEVLVLHLHPMAAGPGVDDLGDVFHGRVDLGGGPGPSGVREVAGLVVPDQPSWLVDRLVAGLARWVDVYDVVVLAAHDATLLPVCDATVSVVGPGDPPRPGPPPLAVIGTA